MSRFNFTLYEFWNRASCQIFNAKTGERIDDKKMLENKDLEVLGFDVKYHYENKQIFIDGIEVLLESEGEE